MRKHPMVARLFAAASVIVFVNSSADAALLTNPAMPITAQVRVRVIAVANDNGTGAAPLFGTPWQQAAIFSFVDTIYAQAGIDVSFSFRSGTYNNTFANSGDGTANATVARPDTDLNTIIQNATFAGGVLDPDPKVLNLFMVQIVPGFPQTNNNTANGLAFLGGNGIAMWAGPALPTFPEGQEVVASVLAHEIGHNLGLDHLGDAQNLMQEGGSLDFGQRLNDTQIAIARGSGFVEPAPEPATVLGLAAFGLAGVWAIRRRRSDSPALAA
jgi:MYXO-CTERM domain-containing protein